MYVLVVGRAIERYHFPVSVLPEWLTPNNGSARSSTRREMTSMVCSEGR